MCERKALKARERVDHNSGCRRQSHGTGHALPLHTIGFTNRLAQDSCMRDRQAIEGARDQVHRWSSQSLTKPYAVHPQDACSDLSDVDTYPQLQIILERLGDAFQEFSGKIDYSTDSFARREGASVADATDCDVRITNLQSSGEVHSGPVYEPTRHRMAVAYRVDLPETGFRGGAVE